VRHRVVAMAVGVVGVLALGWIGPPAEACSCVAGERFDTIEFVGRAEKPLATDRSSLRRNWRFEVQTAVLGVTTGERVVVAVAEGDSAACGTHVRLGRGGIYRVVANHGVVDGETYNGLSLCEGLIEVVKAPASVEPFPDPGGELAHRRVVLAWLVGAGLVVAAVAPVVAVRRARRMRARAGDDPFGG
jgi:hypothetical protein